MNTIKWELEDLAFAILYPKMYDEIVRLVSERAPKREEYLSAGHRRRSRGDLREAQDQGHRHRPAEALLLGLPEDDRARPRLRRHLRPGRHPGPGRLGARLLRGARHHPRAVEPGPRPVQGLHRDAEVQHVPVAAHHGDRPAAASRWSCRSAPTRCTGGPSTASRRTGSTRRTRSSGARRARPTASGGGEPRRRHGLAAPAARLAEGDRRPGRVPRLAALRPVRRRGLRLHAQGRW